MNENARILIFNVPDKTCITVLETTGEDLLKIYLEKRKRLPETGYYFSREIR
jgi:hypothetical protein